VNKDLKKIFASLAGKNGVSPSYIKHEIQKTFDEAWLNENTNTNLRASFPFRKPTLEEFFAFALSEA